MPGRKGIGRAKAQRCHAQGELAFLMCDVQGGKNESNPEADSARTRQLGKLCSIWIINMSISSSLACHLLWHDDLGFEKALQLQGKSIVNYRETLSDVHFT